MKRLFIYLFAATMLTSCGICLVEINGNGYRWLKPEERERVMVCNQPIDSLHCDGNVYQINVQQMRDYLSRHENVIVYEYASYCSNEDCISPNLAEKVCEKYGFDFCLLAESYDNILFIKDIKAPVLTINHELYGTYKTRKLKRLFFDELTGTTEKERGWNRFYRFQNGKYVCTYGSLKEAKYALRKDF